MVWSFMGNARMYQALRDYGDRIDTVGIFTFEVDITGTITETGTSISSMLTYINRCAFKGKGTVNKPRYRGNKRTGCFYG
jgi:hypothetical protein